MEPRDFDALANQIPNSGYVGDLRGLASYFRDNPELLKAFNASKNPFAPTPEPKAVCLDCGRDYADFSMDVLLPRWQWLLIHPSDGGLLCANCIVTRAAKVPGAVALHVVIGIAPTREVDHLDYSACRAAAMSRRA